MTREQYAAFSAIRDDFRKHVAALSREAPWLGELEDRLRRDLGYDDYRIETPVVYNQALDDIGPKDSPRFIIVADNPGKNEQKAENQRYLVGQSGKLAQGWSLHRLDKTMLQILRAGSYELIARADVPTGSAISEYVDVAHAFFDPREAKFVNGVLDAVAKAVR